MWLMSVTIETSHFERGDSKFLSHLKLAALADITFDLPRKNHTKSQHKKLVCSRSRILKTEELLREVLHSRSMVLLSLCVYSFSLGYFHSLSSTTSMLKPEIDRKSCRFKIYDTAILRDNSIRHLVLNTTKSLRWKPSQELQLQDPRLWLCM